jgi:26S proteasome regulatory subunit T4
VCAGLARDVGTPAEVAAYAERACSAYCTAGRAQTGAEALGRCAKMIDEKDGGMDSSRGGLFRGERVKWCRV